MLKLRGRGFSIVELIMALVFAIILFFGVAFVLSNSSSNVQPLIETEKEADLEEEAVEETVLRIEELLVELDIPEEIDGLRAVPQSSFDVGVEAVEFDTTEYRDAIAQGEGVVELCGVEGQGGLGQLIKVARNTSYPGQGIADYEEYSRKNSFTSKTIDDDLYIYDVSTVCDDFFSAAQISVMKKAIRETLRPIGE